MSKVTIIIPSYNPGAYLDETVNSVIPQTFTDWECLVIDDGSQEDLSRIDAVDPRVRRIRQQNRGLSIARNVGLMQSQSEYVAFVDADDLWAPDKLQAQVEMMDAAPEMGLCHTAFHLIDEQGSILKKGWGCPTSYGALLRCNDICVSTVMVRRSCLAVAGLFDPLLRAVQDYDMWLKLARFYAIGFVETPSAFYRLHGSNMSSNYLLMEKEVLEVLNRQKPLVRKQAEFSRRLKNNLREYRVGAGCKSYALARVNLREGDYKNFKTNLLLSMQRAPRYTLRALLRSLFRLRPDDSTQLTKP